jgi:hypothetical protein
VNLQVPYLPEEDLKDLCKDLKQERNKGENKAPASSNEDQENALDVVFGESDDGTSHAT